MVCRLDGRTMAAPMLQLPSGLYKGTLHKRPGPMPMGPFVHFTPASALLFFQKPSFSCSSQSQVDRQWDEVCDSKMSTAGEGSGLLLCPPESFIRAAFCGIV